MKRITAALLCFLIILSGCAEKNPEGSEGSEVEVVVSDDTLIAPGAEGILVSSQEPVPEETVEEASDPDDERDDDTPVDLSWFDDCVFIGDSLVNGLSLYNDVTECFGNAEFICAAGLGYNNCQWDLYDENEVHPLYNGEKILLEDAPNLTGSTKVIIGMGMNDLGGYGVDGTLSAADSFVQRLRDKTPGIEIYLMTVTPMIESAEYDLLNNPLIKEYDDKLEVFAEEHECHFLNTWSALADENGRLPDELCMDPDDLGLHLTNEGSEIMMNYIIRHVG